MKIAVCFKAVQESENLEKNPAGTVSAGNAEKAIGQYDLNALEAAAQLKEAVPGTEVVAVTVCRDETECNSKLKKSVLSKGPDALYSICDPALPDGDSYCTAKTLAALIEKIGEIDLVLCGEGSGDMYSRITGNILGGLLNWNTLNGVNAISVENDKLKVIREIEYASEEYIVSLPAVLSVTGEINRPRISSFKEIMAAGKKPWETMDSSDVLYCEAGSVETISTLAPEQAERKKLIFKGADEETVDNFCAQLKKILREVR